MVVMVYSQWKMCQACDDERTCLFYLHLFISSSFSAFPFSPESPFTFSFGSIYLFRLLLFRIIWLLVSFILLVVMLVDN